MNVCRRDVWCDGLSKHIHPISDSVSIGFLSDVGHIICQPSISDPSPLTTCLCLPAEMEVDLLSSVRSHQQLQGPRAAPGYEELDAARRRVLDHDPHRVSATWSCS